jgi:anthranilate phosphoribosyltransferase
VFNILGPLTNPAGASYQVVGVGVSSDTGQPLGEMMANVLSHLGTKHSWVVRGDDGLDEITTTTTTQVWEVTAGRVRNFEVQPSDAGLGQVALREIQVSGAASHAAMFLDALGDRESAAKDIVMLNASAALVVVGKAADLRAGVIAAREAIDSGAALDKLHKLAALSQELA